MEGSKENVVVEVAFQYNDSYNENIHSYVNNINTIEGVLRGRLSKSTDTRV